MRSITGRRRGRVFRLSSQTVRRSVRRSAVRSGGPPGHPERSEGSRRGRSFASLRMTLMPDFRKTLAKGCPSNRSSQWAIMGAPRPIEQATRPPGTLTGGLVYSSGGRQPSHSPVPGRDRSWVTAGGRVGQSSVRAEMALVCPESSLGRTSPPLAPAVLKTNLCEAAIARFLHPNWDRPCSPAIRLDRGREWHLRISVSGLGDPGEFEVISRTR